MKIEDIGGEFRLIERIKKSVNAYSKDVIAGIGDDAAVLKSNKKNYMLLKIDALVENCHSSLKYSKPEQIGMKAIEQNVSDIAAMGGFPKYAVVSLALPDSIDVEFIDGLYKGINKRAGEYGINIVGGNITHSLGIAINVALIGFVEKEFLKLRSGAKIGDLIFCSGDVGKSAAGLELLRRGFAASSIKKHLEPRCRLDLARKLARISINSMIDVSDGVAPEVAHICEQSGTGAVIYADKIPISKDTIASAKKAGKSALDFALYGGEDFELVFTADKNKLSQFKKYGVSVIGEIVGKKQGIGLVKDNKKIDLESGFEHFKRFGI